MTLEEIKNIIITRSRALEICNTLHNAQIATTQSALIAAGMPLVVWAYQSGVVDDDLLAEFDEALLNSEGIYTIGSFTITDPDKEIYILKTAIATVNYTGIIKRKLNILGTAVVNVSIQDQAYLTLKTYDSATVTLDANNSSMLNVEARENTAITATFNDTTTAQIHGNGKAAISVTAAGHSFSKARLYINSTLEYTIEDSGIVEAEAFQNAIITSGTL